MFLLAFDNFYCLGEGQPSLEESIGFPFLPSLVSFRVFVICLLVLCDFGVDNFVEFIEDLAELADENGVVGVHLRDRGAVGARHGGSDRICVSDRISAGALESLCLCPAVGFFREKYPMKKNALMAGSTSVVAFNQRCFAVSGLQGYACASRRIRLIRGCALA